MEWCSDRTWLLVTFNEWAYQDSRLVDGEAAQGCCFGGSICSCMCCHGLISNYAQLCRHAEKTGVQLFRPVRDQFLSCRRHANYMAYSRSFNTEAHVAHALVNECRDVQPPTSDLVSSGWQSWALKSLHSCINAWAHSCVGFRQGALTAFPAWIPPAAPGRQAGRQGQLRHSFQSQTIQDRKAGPCIGRGK